MKLPQKFEMRWSRPAIPVYDLSYERISRPLLLPDGVVFLDGANLVKVNREGELLWQCSHDYGFWGSPVLSKSGFIVCASNNNQINFLNDSGQIAHVVDLPTSVCTDIIVGNSGSLWFGMGTAYCAVTRINSTGSIVCETEVARDSGLQYPLSLAKDKSIWVAAQDGAIKLEAHSGKVLCRNNNQDNVSCISEILPNKDGLIFASASSDGSSEIVKINSQCQIIKRYSLPPIRRAKLLASPNDGAWLVGSTVSYWKPLDKSDRLLVIRLAPDGKPERMSSTVAGRSIEATLDDNGTLWVGTYTYNEEDDSENGYLMRSSEASKPQIEWLPKPSCGVGIPVFAVDGSGVIATSRAIFGFASSKQ